MGRLLLLPEAARVLTSPRALAAPDRIPPASVAAVTATSLLLGWLLPRPASPGLFFALMALTWWLVVAKICL